MKALLFTFSLFFCFLNLKGQFGHQIEITKSAAQVIDIKSFDMDNDGDMDILTASEYDNKIALYENLGNGIFEVQKIISNQALGAQSIYAADLNGDGFLDILSASKNDNKIAWYQNYGNNNFSGEKIINISAFDARCVYADDMDGDGDYDILSATSGNNKISWYENDGLGNFGQQQDVFSSVNWGSSIVLTADIDNDGDKDIISGNWHQDNITVYENFGGGIFSSGNLVTFLNYPIAIYTADIDGDGDEDIVSAAWGDNKIAWYKNDSTGSFGPSQTIHTFSIGAYGVSAADLDGDLDIDIISCTRDNGEVVWHENNGSGFFSPPQLILQTPGAGYVGASDIDNDGDLDVFAAGTGINALDRNKISWSANDGLANFSPDQYITPSADDINGICALDVENDGDLDIIAAGDNNNSFFWYENLGLGHFGPKQIISDSALGAYDVFPADIDGDGIKDIIGIIRRENTVAWFKNYGNGLFSGKNVISNTLNNPRASFAEDLDGDGDMDIITASNWDDKLAWFENLGLGIFGPEQLISLDNSIEDVLAADINGDGYKDIISGFYGIAWYPNNGLGNFGTQQLLNTNSDRISCIYATDLDLDGDVDILYSADISGEIGWYKNNGLGNFSNKNIISSNTSYASNVYAYDIDGDGDIDVVSASYQDNKIVWYENDGFENFSSEKKITNSSTKKATFVFAVDFDGDGDQELISGSAADDKIAWYENFFNNPKIKGKCYYDVNQNGQRDTNEIGLPFIKTTLQPTGLISFSDNSGNFMFATDTGTYTLGYIPDTLWNLTSAPSSFSINLTTQGQIFSNKDFGFYPDAILTNITPTLTGGFPRCNDTINYWIDIRNEWTTLPSGNIHLTLDDSINFISSDTPPDSIIGKNVYWHYDSLNYFSNYLIKLQVAMPPFTSMGDTLTSYLSVYELDIQNSIIYSNTDTLKQILMCAYDPNDKSVIPQGIGSQGFINKNQELEYLIRFQNTGNDTAITVIIRDQLDESLDKNSFQPIASSHPMTSMVDIHDRIVFRFENIMLPDSNVNPSGSQGFVKYKITPKAGLNIGTPIFNSAHIYFDSNPPIITNTTLNTIDSSGVILSMKDEITFTESNNVIIFPNPFTDNITIFFKDIINQSYNINIIDINGKEVLKVNNITQNKVQFNLSTLSKGIYVITSIDSNGNILFSEKIISK